MNILRAILVGLAGFVCTIAISGFISLLSLQSTILDRTVVKSWLAANKVYDGRLLSALIQTPNAGGIDNSTPTPQPQTGSNIPPDAIQTALNATFTPDFVQTQTEGVINNAYDWMEGKTPEFKFSIPVDQRRTTFIQQLAKAIEPQIAALPVCQSVRQAQQSTCRPRNISAEQLANQTATQSINESGAFTAPITNKSITKSSQESPQQSNESLLLAQLPAIRAGIDMLLIVLPIVAAISIAIVILATKSGRRLLASSRLSRRIFFSMLFILIPAIVIIWAARNNDFSFLSNMFATQVGEVVVPLIKTIIVALATKLALLSGITCIVTAITWVGLTIWRRKLQAIEATQTPDPVPLVQPTPLPRQPQDFI